MEVSKEASKLGSENFLISSDIEKFRLISLKMKHRVLFAWIVYKTIIKYYFIR